MWSLHYAALLEYYKEYGTCNLATVEYYDCELPNMGDDGGTYHYKHALGSWLSAQRTSKKNNTMPAEREAKFQKLVDEGSYYQKYDIYHD